LDKQRLLEDGCAGRARFGHVGIHEQADGLQLAVKAGWPLQGSCRFRLFSSHFTSQ
jgi:hypothetical protein